MRWRFLILMALAAGAAVPAGAAQADAKGLAEEILRSAGVTGGLCVHLGCGDGALTAELAASGRFLVHGLEPDAPAAEAAQRRLRSRGVYGLAWAEHYTAKELPYAENLVNLLVADDLARTGVAIEEIMRVLAPNGVALIGPKRERIQKPWPPEMDDWGHPRHGADGNAASRDELVGPPRRIRWVSGPWQESSSMAIAGGRFYHGGLIARDAFNGLRLWERPLTPAPLRLGFTSASPAGSVLPVATRDRLFAVTDKRLAALDPASGQTLRTYPKAGTPAWVLHDNGLLLATTRKEVRALDAASGNLLWTASGSEIEEPVACEDGVFLLEGDVKRGEQRSIVCLDRATGRERWRRNDTPWAARARRLSCGKGLVICEVSTFKDDKPGNSIHVLNAPDGSLRWERVYEPGMSHFVQARAIGTADLVWILHHGDWLGLDPADGAERKKAPAAGGHCFPPVGTPRFLIAGEMSFSDLRLGKLDANRISKGNCSREAGFLPANGLLYVSPKHCACWPMLRGYSALAPAHPAYGNLSTNAPRVDQFALERGPAFGAPAPARARDGLKAALRTGEWPCYRADAWRSGGTAASVPADLEVLWTARLGAWPKGTLALDWSDNLYSRGPLTPPVAAEGLVVVARPDAHQVLAFDAQTGQPRWDFTANGRVDTSPTLHDGLCLFGTRSGWVYCLRASDGGLVWRLRAAPHEERIVSFGQLESPWPVPGSVLVADGLAYFAAGRQPLADGGILVFAVEPRTGAIEWVKRQSTLPMGNFYGGSGLEFDPFDLLVAESRRPDPAAKEPEPAADGPDFVTMSRWRFAPKTGGMTVAWHSGFGWARTGGCGAMAPRGVWTYGPRMDYAWDPKAVNAEPRALVAFRGSVLVGASENKRQIFRTDFSPDRIATFNDSWYSQGQIPRKKEDKGDRNRNERLAHEATWTVDWAAGPPTLPGADPRTRSGVGALVLAGDTVFAAGEHGRLFAFAAADGRKLAERNLPPPIWDGLAAAYGRLYVATQSGDLICLGKK